MEIPQVFSAPEHLGVNNPVSLPLETVWREESVSFSASILDFSSLGRRGLPLSPCLTPPCWPHFLLPVQSLRLAGNLHFGWEFTFSTKTSGPASLSLHFLFFWGGHFYSFQFVGKTFWAVSRGGLFLPKDCTVCHWYNHQNCGQFLYTSHILTLGMLRQDAQPFHTSII